MQVQAINRRMHMSRNNQYTIFTDDSFSAVFAMPHSGSTLNETNASFVNQQQQQIIQSVVESSNRKIPRRTFGLFCLCDTLLIFLLWTIYLSIRKTGDQDFMDLFVQQIKNYTFETSLADVVTLSFIRDLILVLVYLIFRFDHWITAGVCAVGSSAFLLAKVFLYPLGQQGQPLTYFLILGSFAMTWIATYLVDFKKLKSSNEFSPLYVPGSTVPRYDFSAAGVGHNTISTIGNELLINGDLPGNTHIPPQLSLTDDRAPSEFYSIAGSIAGDNRQLMEKIEENDGLHEIDKAAIQNSHESYELGLRLYELDGGEWKLEECGRFGTCVNMKDVEDIGRVYKMEMLVSLSAETLLKHLTDYSSISGWDKTVDTITPIVTVNDTVNLLRIVAQEIEVKKKIPRREYIVAMKTSKINGVVYSFGSSIDYPESTHANGEKITRAEHKITGFVIKPVSSDSTKCELIKFVSTDIKGWIAQFRADKAITQSLLLFAECLQDLAEQLNDASRDMSYNNRAVTTGQANLPVVDNTNA